MKRTCANKSLVALIWLTSFWANTIVAQTGVTDTSFYRKAVNNVISVYHQTVGDQSRLFDGTQYANYLFSFADRKHPFFLSSAFSDGSIVYNQVFYTNIHLLYDEVAGVLVFQDSSHRIQLHNERISAFSILDNHFIRLEKDSLNTEGGETGFYQVLYNGTTQVLKREIKTITQDISSIAVGVVGNIKVKRLYFIKIGNTYVSIKKEKDLRNALKDREKDLQQYIKSHKLSFKRDIDNTLIQVAAYYDQLKQ